MKAAARFAYGAGIGFLATTGAVALVLGWTHRRKLARLAELDTEWREDWS